VRCDSHAAQQLPSFLPALVLNYFGQGAMVLSDPSTSAIQLLSRRNAPDGLT
jgi:K+ transporter